VARERNSSKVLFIGQFPPPINGLTFITSRLAAALGQAGYDVAIISTTGPSGNRSVFFHVSRLRTVCCALLSMAKNAFLGDSRVCYFTAEGGLGLVYSVMIAVCARLLRLRIYIHHHSFSYIVRQRRLMKLLLAWSGAETVHICLSSGMSQNLASCYDRSINALVLSNAAFVDFATFESSPPTCKEITIGLLSNLTADKGLHEFTEIVRIARQRAMPIRGVLAGPIVADKDRAAVESLREELGECLDYRGPIYGDKKVRFFMDIDVFVFLTTYLNEAQPTVLFEAMAHGIPVISLDRGCIRSQVADGGYVLPQGADIISETLKVLERYCDEPGYLVAQRQAALSHFKVEKSRSQERIANLFEARPVEVTPFGRNPDEN
jgi:glycosyltransferase involved in cell wall biosynthesis